MITEREALMTLPVRELLTLLYASDPSMARPVESVLDTLANQARHQQPGTYAFHPRLAQITGDRRHAA